MFGFPHYRIAGIGSVFAQQVIHLVSVRIQECEKMRVAKGCRQAKRTYGSRSRSYIISMTSDCALTGSISLKLDFRIARLGISPRAPMTLVDDAGMRLSISTTAI